MARALQLEANTTGFGRPWCDAGISHSAGSCASLLFGSYYTIGVGQMLSDESGLRPGKMELKNGVALCGRTREHTKLVSTADQIARHVRLDLGSTRVEEGRISS